MNQAGEPPPHPWGHRHYGGGSGCPGPVIVTASRDTLKRQPTDYFLCAGHCLRHFICFNSFNLLRNPMRSTRVSAFHFTGEETGPGRLHGLRPGRKWQKQDLSPGSLAL